MSAGVADVLDEGKSPHSKRKIARRLTINGPLGFDLEGSKYAVKGKSSKSSKKRSKNQPIGNCLNYGEEDNDGVQPDGGTQASGSLPMLYGTCSRAGKKPSRRRKENQDCFAVIDSYLNLDNQMFLGVFDGHGPNGGLVSRYCRDKLPKRLRKCIDNDGSIKDCEKKNKLHEAIRNACYDTNKSLTESSIDVYVSGTTCISGIISGKTLYTINIGDSRAVMGRMVNGKLRSVDLSVDQKPDRHVSTQCPTNPYSVTSNQYCALLT